MACDHAGMNYGQIFRGQWDDFYLRGIDGIEHGDFQQAIDDFHSSLERRPPSKQYDRRMVRAYGMHYLDYFPHREIGFVHYLQNNYNKALKYLKRSIQSEPSAKAWHYLKETKKKIHDSHSPIKTDVPILTLAEPESIDKQTIEIWRSEMPFMIRGSADDHHWISSLFIQDKPVFLDHADSHVNFSSTLFFQEGEHTISIKATNIVGGSIEKQIVLHVDQTGPILTCKKMDSTESIKIIAKDNSRQISLWINNISVTSTENNLLNWEMKWPTDKRELSICAIDRCKNKTCAIISYDQIFARKTSSVLIAETTHTIVSDNHTLSVKTQGRGIVIQTNQSNGTSVYNDSIEVSGKIKSDRPVAQILINQVLFPSIETREIFFSRRIYLKPGNNAIDISVTDTTGFHQTKTIHIRRKISSVMQLHHRYGMSIYPFTIHGVKKRHWLEKWFEFFQTDNDRDHSYQERQFEKTFIKQFIDQKRFRINYRGKPFKNLKQPHVKSSPFHATLLGDTYVSRFGVEITARIVDNQTSAVLTIKDVYRENRGKMNTEQMAEELSEKIHQTFPLVKGKIIATIENGFRIETSASYMPEIAWPMLVYQKDESSNFEINDTTILGKATITPYVSSNRFKMIVVDDWSGKNEVKCGYWVIAQ